MPARKPKPRRGRPPLGDKGLSHPLTIKITPAQREQWGAAAASAGLSLGEWLREAAELALARGSTR